MISESELLDAIAECERAKPSYQACEKLATFYTVYDHLHPVNSAQNDFELIALGDYGTSDFLNAIRGKNAREICLKIDDLLQALSVLNPKLYAAFMEKVQ